MGQAPRALELVVRVFQLCRGASDIGLRALVAVKNGESLAHLDLIAFGDLELADDDDRQ